MALLDRKQLLKKDKLKIEKVELPGGDHVFVREMTGRERDTFEQSLIKENKEAVGGIERSLEDFRAKIAVVTMCDEQGNLLLTPKDASVLSTSMSAAKLSEIANKASVLNAITQSDKETLVKNSEPGQDDSSGSASVEN